MKIMFMKLLCFMRADKKRAGTRIYMQETNDHEMIKIKNIEKLRKMQKEFSGKINADWQKKAVLVT